MIYNNLTADDVTILLFVLIATVLIAVIFDEIINFIPDLMKSIVRRVRNNNMIHDNESLKDNLVDSLQREKLDTSLEKSDFGLSDLISRYKNKLKK